ncbi:MAG TPA: Calx-beta domain-containing protein [Chloroflexia bacterium]|nr:Calx-beta domain-containing protein [Chloroflexia bacterium]
MKPYFMARAVLPNFRSRSLSNHKNPVRKLLACLLIAGLLFDLLPAYNAGASASVVSPLRPATPRSASDTIDFSSSAYSVNENAGNPQITLTRQGSGAGTATAYINPTGGTASTADFDRAAPGNIEASFNNRPGPAGGVYAMQAQSDGKIVMAGSFSRYSGVKSQGLARINPDGTLDTGFSANLKPGTDKPVTSLIIQPDGKILIAGSFTTFNGYGRNGIARLNSDGTLDETFYSGSGASNSINAIALDANGKILVGGNFDNFNGTSCRGILRLLSDGTVDPSFNPGVGVDSASDEGKVVTSIVIQPQDGKILIGGYFSSYNGVSRVGLARLFPDGSLDPSFNPGQGAVSNPYGNFAGVSKLTLQPDGKILVGGFFSYYDGESVNYLTRVNPDGSRDKSFLVNGLQAQLFEVITVNNIKVLSNNKILVLGQFFSYTDTPMNRIALLNMDGTLDPSFTSPGPGTSQGFSEPATDALVLPDSSILVGGDFDNYGQVNGRNDLIRLNSNGTLRNDFYPITGPDDRVYSVDLDNTGRVLIGGDFKVYSTVARPYLARLSSDSQFDTTFNQGGSGPDGSVRVVKWLPGGKILIAGNFENYNGTPRNRIALLNADGTLDTSFDPGTGASLTINTLAVQADGKILIGGEFTGFNSVSRNHIARLNSNGSLDTTFNPGSGTESIADPLSEGIVYALLVQPDGKILVGGTFDRYNGTVKKGLVRITATGAVDSGFDTGSGVEGNASFFGNTGLSALALLPDGRIFIGGDFATYNGTDRKGIARLASNGSLDTSFVPGVALDDAVLALAVQPDGKLIVGGKFYFGGNAYPYRMLRLNTDGSKDTTFNSDGDGAFQDHVFSGSIDSLALQPDGSVIAGGSFNKFNGASRNNLARLSGDLVVSWADGETGPKTLPLPVLDDNLYEGNETLQLSIGEVGGSAGAQVGTSGSTTLTIVDNDGVPGIKMLSNKIVEGNSGQTVSKLRAVLTNPSVFPITVNYSTTQVNGTATAGQDYVAASGSLVFDPGSVSRSDFITINGDTDVEPDETFEVVLSNPTNATLLLDRAAQTIVNDDTLRLNINSISLLEGNSGTTTATFDVTLSAPDANNSVTVNYATVDGSATVADNDYQPASGVLTFAPGTTSQQISVAVNGDTKLEPDEDFSVLLYNSNGAQLGTFAGKATIKDDDCQPLVVEKDTGGEECGTLRYALAYASSKVKDGPVNITFKEGISEIILNGYQENLSALDNTTANRITISGSTTTENVTLSNGNTVNRCVPGVWIHGINKGTESGFVLGSNVTLKGLSITGFTVYQVEMNGDNNELNCTRIGTGDGISGQDYTGPGVKINGNNNRLGLPGAPESGNLISGNEGSGIVVEAGKDNSAYYNWIGYQKNGKDVLANKGSAVKVQPGGQLKYGPGNRIHS